VERELGYGSVIEYLFSTGKVLAQSPAPQKEKQKVERENSHSTEGW
jgi:hypothetical protein